MYFVVTLCNATGACTDFQTKVQLMPGMLPEHACMFVGQQQAGEIAAAHPGWYLKRWTCSEKEPAQAL